MPKPKPADVAFAVLAALAVVIGVALLLILVGVVDLAEPKPAAEPEPAALAEGEPAAPAPAPQKRVAPRPPQKTTSATTAPETTAPPAETEPAETAPARPRPAGRGLQIVVAATRGDCWISARVPAENRVLLARVLTQGETVTLRGPTVELSLGAAANVDVRVNGRPRSLPAGTVTVLLRAAEAPAAA